MSILGMADLEVTMLGRALMDVRRLSSATKVPVLMDTSAVRGINTAGSRVGGCEAGSIAGGC